MTTADDATDTGRAEQGTALRRRREQLGLTRAQVASLAGCGLAQLAAIEQGAVPRRSDVLVRAAAALDEMEASR